MVKQYLFIDESGNTSAVGKSGATPVFVMSGILFPDQLATVNTVDKIRCFRKRLSLKEAFEFKYHKTKDEVKRLFLNAMLVEDYTPYCLVAKKAKLRYRLIYTDCLEQLIAYVRQNIKEDMVLLSIIVDGQIGKAHMQEIKRVIRSKVKNTSIQVRDSNSKNDDLIQLADMVSGLVYETELKGVEKSLSAEFYNKIRRFYLVA